MVIIGVFEALLLGLNCLSEANKVVSTIPKDAHQNHYSISSNPHSALTSQPTTISHMAVPYAVIGWEESTQRTFSHQAV